MLKYCLLYTTLIMSVSGYAQPLIKGKVEDSLKAPVAYCPLALMNASDSSVAKGNITNDNGEFVFENVARGRYFIRINYLGYSDYFSAPFAVDSLHPQVTLEPLSLKSKETNLKEVSVTAFRPTVEFKDGVVVLNVENDIISSGNTVLDLLKRVPGVSVDAQNNITVNGKSGARFMIDGRLQQIPTSQIINLLSNMSSESVSSLVLIKNPPAKYDASGTGGLINIVTRRINIKGFNGNITESFGQGKRYGNNASLALNFKSNKLSVFTNIFYLTRDIFDLTESDRTLNTPPESESINSTGNNEAFRNVGTISAGMEYKFTERTTLGANFSGGPTISSAHRRSTSNISGNNSPGYDQLIFKTDNDETFWSPTANINLLHLLDTNGTQLFFSADYTNFLYSQDNLNRNYFLNNTAEAFPMINYRNTTQLNFKIATQKVDFTKQLSKTLTFEGGLKSSFVVNDNDSKLERNYAGTENYYKDSTFSNKFNYNEKIFAGYVTFTKAFKKVNMQAGVRAEQTNIDAVNKTNGYTLSRNYINFFPNAFVDYKPNQKLSYQVSYSYRIDRPNYDQLNPAKIFIDQLDYGIGNPALRPQYSHNINVEISYNNFITNSFAFTNIQNSIYNYSYTDASTLVNVDTVYNFSQKNMASYGLYIQKQFGPLYRMQLSGLAAYMYSSSQIQGAQVKTEILAVKASLNNEFFLPKGYKLQLFASYATPYRDGVQLYSQRGSLNLAIQKRFLKNQLTVSLGLYDILYTDFGSLTTKLPGQTNYYWEKNDTRRVRITLSYKFGNMKIDKTIENKDKENIRVKKAKS